MLGFVKPIRNNKETVFKNKVTLIEKANTVGLAQNKVKPK